MSKRAINVARVAAIFGILSGIAAHPAHAQSMCSNGCVTTYAYDNSRDNVNSNEQGFKAGTIHSTLTVDSVSNLHGIIYAQPLFISNMTISSHLYDVLFVATEENWVYALDANNLSATPLWSANLNDITMPDGPVPDAQLPGMCPNITPEVGITGTPVIDIGSSSNLPNVLYAVSKHYHAGGSPAITQRVNALDIFTGAPVGPAVDIATLYSGFSASDQNQRAGLALRYDSNNDPIIYVAWGSHCDSGTYTGKVAAFEATGTAPSVSIALDSTFDTSGGLSGATQGGIWMGGAGPAIDDVAGPNTSTSFDVFLSTGNGTFQHNTTGASAFGESVLRLHAGSSGLSVLGNYTPNEWKILNDGSMYMGMACGKTLALPAPYPALSYLCTDTDLDLDAGGNILARPTNPANMLPSTDNFAVLSGGKEGVFYVVSPHTLTTVRGADTSPPCTSLALQCFGATTLPVYDNTMPTGDSTGSRCGPSFWSGTSTYQQNTLYVAGSGDSKIRSYQMAASGNNANFGTSLYGYANAPNPDPNGNIGYPGNCPVITWNAATGANTDALLWILDTSGLMTAAPAQLFGYQAVPTASGGAFSLKTSDTTNGPAAVEFTVPTVVDGHVFAAGQVKNTLCTLGPCSGVVVSWH